MKERKRPIGRGRAALPKAIQKALEPYVDEARMLSAEFVKAAAERFDEPGLDFSIDSVRTVDRILRFHRGSFDDGLVLQAGFYLGETLRSTYRGRYQWDARMKALSLGFEELTIFPIEKVRTAVQGKGGTLEEYLMVLAKKLADHRGHGKIED